MFEIGTSIKEGSRLIDLDHPFWNREDIKKEIRNVIVTNQPIKEKEFQMETRSGEIKTIFLRSKSIYSEPGERKILILIKERSTH